MSPSAHVSCSSNMLVSVLIKIFEQQFTATAFALAERASALLTGISPSQRLSTESGGNIANISNESQSDSLQIFSFFSIRIRVNLSSLAFSIFYSLALSSVIHLICL